MNINQYHSLKSCILNEPNIDRIGEKQDCFSRIFKNKSYLSHDAVEGWSVKQLNFIQQIFRSFSFFRSTHLHTVVDALRGEHADNLLSQNRNENVPIVEVIDQIQTVWERHHPDINFPNLGLILISSEEENSSTHNSTYSEDSETSISENKDIVETIMESERTENIEGDLFGDVTNITLLDIENFKRTGDSIVSVNYGTYVFKVKQEWLEKMPEEVLKSLHDDAYVSYPGLTNIRVKFMTEEWGQYEKQEGYDAGGLSRHFMSALFQGISLIPEKETASVMDFEKDHGLIIPKAKFRKYLNCDSENLVKSELLEALGLAFGDSIPDRYISSNGKVHYAKVRKNFGKIQEKLCRLTEDESKAYKMIGALFALCQSKPNYVIGQIFDDNLFKSLCQFTSPEIDNDFETLSGNRLLEIYRTHMSGDAQSTQWFRIINKDPKNLTDVELMTAVYLAYEDPDEYAGEIQNIYDADEIRTHFKEVRRRVIAKVKTFARRDLAPVHMMAKGIKSFFDVQGYGVESWENIRQRGDEQLSDAIQGRLSKDLIKEIITYYDGVGDRSIDRIKGYMDTWINEAMDDELKDFVQAITGCSAIGGNARLLVNLYGGGHRLPEFHTCSSEMDLRNTHCYANFKKDLDIAIASAKTDGFLQE